MSDRTDSPGGSGFALENRIVISRAFPNEFRQCNVQRLAPYFLALRNHLISLSPRKIENPHIAILSAGTGSKSYFEDSFLARYLGFTLVEANDLVVRSGRVMLKTLAGLTPVDVIMRREQGNQLDPLELGGRAPGIAGILQVIRDGKVAVVSGPGSGLVESPIFMAFMPQISKALLKEDLLMPGVATWWGGQPQSQKLILDRIDEVHLLPAFRQRTIAGVKPHPSMLVDPQTFSREQRIKLIEGSPEDWVAQEKIKRPSAAVWSNGKLESGFVSMRTFFAAEGEQWSALPGGLVRVSKTSDELVSDPFEGGGTKDAWVLGDKPAEHVSLFTSTNSSLKTSRAGGFLSSRMADNLCWLGRYLERAEATARLLRAVIVRLTNEIDPSESVELPVLIRALAVEGRIEVSFAIKEFANQLPGLDHYLTRNMLDRSDPDSLRSLVDKIASLASSVRERLSTDTWRIVQGISSNFESSEPESGDLAELLEVTDELVVDLASFSGIISESMTRTDAFRFLNIGRRLEGALQLVALLRNCFADPKQIGGDLLEAVLEVADSNMTYRSRYYANLNLSAVMDLLIVDESNPRSLGFQLVALNADLDALPGNSEQYAYSAECKMAIDTLHLIRMKDLSVLCDEYSAGNKKTMMEFFADLEERLPQIWVAISNRFLVHSGPVTQMITDDFGRGR